MPRRRGNAGHDISAEINVTSLVDVAFTLLVIFIITAPMMQGGVEVKLPRARTEAVPASDGLMVSINQAGEIFVGQEAIAWEQFETRFPALVRERGTSSVYLRADAGVPYGRVAQVLGAMKAADVATVGLVAEPEPAKRR